MDKRNMTWLLSLLEIFGIGTPNATKLGAPTFRFDSLTGAFVLDILVTSAVLEPQSKRKKSGTDPGKVKPFAGVVLHPDGNYSSERTISPETRRANEKFKALDREASKRGKYLAHEEKVLEKFSSEAQKANIEANRLELARIRAKKARVAEFVDWNAANDVVNHAIADDAEIALEIAKFNTGESRFRSGSFGEKLEHVAARESAKITRVSAYKSSQLCPVCREPLVHGRDRVVSCSSFDCGFVEDRDVCGALNHAVRGFEKSGEQVVPVVRARGSRKSIPKRLGRLRSSRKSLGVTKSFEVSGAEFCRLSPEGCSVVYKSRSFPARSERTARNNARLNEQVLDSIRKYHVAQEKSKT